MRYIMRVVEEHTGRIVRSSELSCVLEALVLEAKRVAAAAQISEIALDAKHKRLGPGVGNESVTTVDKLTNFRGCSS